MGHLCRNYKKIPGSGAAAPSVDGLNAFAGEVEHELRVGVAMWCDFGIAVAVELQLAEHKAERVDFYFLNQEWAPGEHGIGFVLAKVGIMLTQSVISS